MRIDHQRLSAFLLVPLLVLACAAPARSPATQSQTERQAEPAPSGRTLVIIGRGEPPSIAAKPLLAYSGSLAAPLRLFNAMLDYIDEREEPRPYLAEAVPQLGTDSWRVLPDGRMETVHRLKANLAWHDGTPLTGDDFVFAWRVYSTPELGQSASSPLAEMAEIATPDSRTVVIRWRQIYPDAAGLDMSYQPLPRHILEQPFQQLDAQAFSNHPFWTHDYVGLGPYKIDRWEPGSSIEGIAFPGHALGRAKIDRVRVIFIADSNTALANLLSGDAHYLSDFVLWYEEGATLESQWAPRNAGILLYAPVLNRITGIQVRPEFANPRGLVQVGVRRALTYGWDAQTVVDVTTGGRGLVTSTLTSPQSPNYPPIERVVDKRPYDSRLVQRYLEEAGMVKGADGFFVGRDGEPFRIEVSTDGGSTNERENAIFVDGLRRAGVDAFSRVIPVAQLRDSQARSAIPALTTGGIGGKALNQFVSWTVPRAENRWSGNNRGGWTSPEYDRLWQGFNTTLDRSQRLQAMAEMERMIFDEAGVIPGLFTVVVNAHVSQLEGPVVRSTPDAGGGILHIHTWKWR